MTKASTPEQDILAIEAVGPERHAEDLPGLVTGQRILEALNNGLSLVRAGVPKAARTGLIALDRELRQILSAQGDGPSLPESYRSGNELWLPVRSQRLRVRLDAPDLRMRPLPKEAGGRVGNLTAMARRTDWLPLRATAWRVEAALEQLIGGASDLRMARRTMETAIQGVQSRIRLENRPLIMAYYLAEEAMAAAPHWPDGLRSRMRHGAEALKEAQEEQLAQRMQAQADQITPNLMKLQGLALDLRRQIQAAVAAGKGG